MAAQTGRALSAGVIGDPIAHSLSPAIHTYWLKEHRIDGTYVPIRVPREDFADSIRDLHQKGYRGVNVTLPHKEAAFALANWKDEFATKTGAVNTLVFEKNQIKGYNTDVFGFAENLRASLNPVESYIDSCLVLGAGGASRGIIQALLSLGARQIFLSNRTQSKAQQLVEEFQSLTSGASPVSCIAWENRHEPLRDVSLVVNATQLGMIGQPELDLRLDTLSKHAAVTDIVYKPLKTPLLVDAEAAGIRVADGLGMLLWQAALGFEMWFGPKPTVTAALRRHVESFL